MLFCSDMLNLPEFKGLCPALATTPSLVYFHENQLCYPVENERERDAHFGFTNIVTALAADRTWFNSSYHLETFADAADAFIRRMPDGGPLDVGERIHDRAVVRYPGINIVSDMPPRTRVPLRILWAARWEADKNPGLFVEALKRLAGDDIPFTVSMVGGNSPERDAACFDPTRKALGDRVVDWGYLESRDGYARALAEADVVVSTAHHEFFGIGVVEAIAAGAYPLLPDRLAYPEVLARIMGLGAGAHLYDGTVEMLTARLRELAREKTAGTFHPPSDTIRDACRQFTWPVQIPTWDDELEQLAKSCVTV
jgi:glycosyltransferase involved in cell wall biosynthesis